MGIFKKGPIEELPKINCLACGKENDSDSKYCKHCGAPAEPETQKIPQHLKGKKSRKKLFVVLLVVIIIIAAILSIIIVTYEDMDEIVTYTYSPEETPSSLKIEVDMVNASVEFKFTSDLTEPVVKMDYHKKWQGWVIIKPSFKTSSSKVTFEGSEVMGQADSELTVILLSDVEYDIECTTTSGSITLTSDTPGVILGTVAFESYGGTSSIHGVNLTITEQIKLRSEDGSASVNLKDCEIGDIDSTISSDSKTSNIDLENCIIDDIHVLSDTGSFTFNSKDSKSDSHSSWSFDVDSGSVVMSIEQSSPLGADVTVDASVTGSKDIEVNYIGNATYIRAKFNGNKLIDIKENSGFDILDSRNLESLNFGNETLDLFDIKMTANKGDLEVEVSNL
jgi:hypothetical protein